MRDASSHDVDMSSNKSRETLTNTKTRQDQTRIMAVQSRVAAVTGANKGIGLAIGQSTTASLFI